MSTEVINEVEKLADIQEEQETRKIYLRQVGIREIVVPVIYSQCGVNSTSVANMKVAVDLECNKRAIHMSRLIESVSEWGGIINETSIHNFLKQIMDRLYAYNAYVEIDFTYFTLKEAPISKKKARMNYRCKIKGNLKKRQTTQFEIEIKVPITSVCPCSKAISEFGAHNQRGIVSVILRNAKIEVIPDIIERVEKSASCQLYSLLKRADEKYVTEYAYKNAKFVEDIARDVTLCLKEDGSYSNFIVDVENYESIHNHNAYTIVTDKDLVEENE